MTLTYFRQFLNQTIVLHESKTKNVKIPFFVPKFRCGQKILTDVHYHSLRVYTEVAPFRGTPK